MKWQMILQNLIRGSTDKILMAYQIAFDLYESATQQFLNKIQEVLRDASTYSNQSRETTRVIISSE